VTSRETPDISTKLHVNMSMLHQRKSMSLLSYLGSKLAPIYMVLARSLALICTALVSLSVLKMLHIRGMARLSSVVGILILRSLSSITVTIAVASSMLSCSCPVPVAS
jgi:hypothetical protein